MESRDFAASGWKGVDTPTGARWTLPTSRGYELVALFFERSERWAWQVVSASGAVLGRGDATNLLGARTASHDFYVQRLA